MGCDLEVDVNGEEVFVVDKKLFASFSGRFCKLFGELAGTSTNLRVIFQDFPGGAEGFELMARFCYSNGRAEITPSNVVTLNYAAHFMEMDGDSSGTLNLVAQTENSLGDISFWTWSELLTALKQCQDSLPATSSSFVIERILNCLVGKLVLPSPTSPYAFSSEKSIFRFSCDSDSSCSLKSNGYQTTWWFKDLVFLNTSFLEKIIRVMLSQELEHAIVFKFLFYYQRWKVFVAKPAEKCEILKVVIMLLCLLDRSSLSFNGLFNIYLAAISANLSKLYRNRLETLIGSQLDQATVNHLLVPSPRGKDYIYDVNMVVRFVKAFLLEGGSSLLLSRSSKVARLIDSYLAEVAPDSHLKLSKFQTLVLLLPDCARESHDRLYQAMNMYFEVHADELCDEEKNRACLVLNYEKLSSEALNHLARNSNFPSRISVKAFMSQNSKIRTLIREIYHLKTFKEPSLCGKSKVVEGSKVHDEQIHSNVRQTEKLEGSLNLLIKEPSLCSKLKVVEGSKVHDEQIHGNVRETENFGADHLQGMPWLRREMENIMKSRLSSLGHSRFLPKLCS
ncbi:hypothetical protein UlMin_011621 [Ulmus minor]